MVCKKMMGQIKTGLIGVSIVLVVTMSLASPAQAQPSAPPAATAPPTAEQKAHSSGGPRKQLATIIFAGLGGAILGLSTLSFYGRPQDYLANLPIGFGIGIIAGTAFVTYRAVTNPQELYGLKPPTEDNLDYTNAHALATRSVKPLGLNLAWDF